VEKNSPSLRERKENSVTAVPPEDVLSRHQFESSFSAWRKLRALKRANNFRTNQANTAYVKVLLELKKLKIKTTIKHKYGIFSFLMNSEIVRMVLPLRDKNKAEALIKLVKTETGDEMSISVTRIGAETPKST